MYEYTIKCVKIVCGASDERQPKPIVKKIDSSSDDRIALEYRRTGIAPK